MGTTAAQVANHICSLFYKYNSKTRQVFFTMYVQSHLQTLKNTHIIINAQRSAQRLTTSLTKDINLKRK